MYVPFLFVPHGASPLPEWLAAHPGWLAVPATLVIAAGAAGLGRVPARDDGGQSPSPSLS